MVGVSDSDKDGRAQDSSSPEMREILGHRRNRRPRNARQDGAGSDPGGHQTDSDEGVPGPSRRQAPADRIVPIRIRHRRRRVSVRAGPEPFRGQRDGAIPGHLNANLSSSDSHSSSSLSPPEIHVRLRPYINPFAENGNGRLNSDEEVWGPPRRQLVPNEEIPGPSRRRTVSNEEVPGPSRRRLASNEEVPGPSRRRLASNEEVPGPSRRRLASNEEVPGPSRRRRLASNEEVPGPSRRRLASNEEVPGPSRRRLASNEEVPSPSRGRRLSDEVVSDPSPLSSLSISVSDGHSTSPGLTSSDETHGDKTKDAPTRRHSEDDGKASSVSTSPSDETPEDKTRVSPTRRHGADTGEETVGKTVRDEEVPGPSRCPVPLDEEVPGPSRFPVPLDEEVPGPSIAQISAGDSHSTSSIFITAGQTPEVKTRKGPKRRHSGDTEEETIGESESPASYAAIPGPSNVSLTSEKEVPDPSTGEIAPKEVVPDSLNAPSLPAGENKTIKACGPAADAPIPSILRRLLTLGDEIPRPLRDRLASDEGALGLSMRRLAPQGIIPNPLSTPSLSADAITSSPEIKKRVASKRHHPGDAENELVRKSNRPASDASVLYPSRDWPATGEEPPGPSRMRLASDEEVAGPSGVRIATDDEIPCPSRRRLASDEPVPGPSRRLLATDEAVASPSRGRIAAEEEIPVLRKRRLASDDEVPGPSKGPSASHKNVLGPFSDLSSLYDVVPGPLSGRLTSYEPVPDLSRVRMASDEAVAGPSRSRLALDEAVSGPSTRRLASQKKVLAPLSALPALHEAALDPLSGRPASDESVPGPSRGQLASDEAVAGPSRSRLALDEAVLGPSTRRLASQKKVLAPLSALPALHEAALVPLSGRPASDESVPGPSRGQLASDEAIAGPLRSRPAPDEPVPGPSKGRLASQKKVLGPLSVLPAVYEAVPGPSSGRPASDKPVPGPSRGRLASDEAVAGPSSLRGHLAPATQAVPGSSRDIVQEVYDQFSRPVRRWLPSLYWAREEDPNFAMDPRTRLITPNVETTIEINTGDRVLGIVVLGGCDTKINGPAAVVLDAYNRGSLILDGRLNVGDQIRCCNGVQITADMTRLEIRRLIKSQRPNLILTVYRPDPLRFELVSTSLSVAQRLSHRPLGFHLMMPVLPNRFASVYILYMEERSPAARDGRLQVGDFFAALDGVNVVDSECITVGIGVSLVYGKIDLIFKRFYIERY